MPEPEKNDVHHKALSLNLDPTKFGSFAEIGAGQEVARWFLQVGGASGTVAKTISAYDKEVSDDLYGSGTRYVSKPRLQAMLESEWKQLLSQLQSTRGANTRFFSFVDTISARNFAGTNDQHGWVGVRFQQQPGGPANDIIVHINLMDPTNLQQQEAVGILGVNLIHAAYHALGSAEEFLDSIFGQLGTERIEIDLLEWTGDAFDGWNRDEVHALLVAGGYAEAVTFPADSKLVPPNELLYKRALVLAPGRFDNVSELHGDLIDDTLAQLPDEELKESKGGLGLFCLSVAGISAPGTQASVKEILEHIEDLQRLGYGVMLFRARELYTGFISPSDSLSRCASLRTVTTTCPEACSKPWPGSSRKMSGCMFIRCRPKSCSVARLPPILPVGPGKRSTEWSAPTTCIRQGRLIACINICSRVNLSFPRCLEGR